MARPESDEKNTARGSTEPSTTPPQDIAAENMEEPLLVQEEAGAKQLAEAQQKLAESADRLLRLAAEFDNYKKRMERERDITLKFAEENILRDLLPGLDNLERAMVQGRETNNIDSLLEGLELTRKGLLETLERFGVTPVVSVGAEFDPNLHEALAMEENGEEPANRVVKELLKGYHYKDRLLRAAKVIVSKGAKSTA